MHPSFALRCLALALVAALCASCGAKRDTARWTSAVSMTIDLDEGFIAQQTGILARIATIRAELEWKYNKGEVIAKNVAGTVLVVAVIAGVVVLMAATNSSGSIGGSGSAGEKEPEPLQLIIADRTCTKVYHQETLKPGRTLLDFKAPAGEVLYLFAALGDIRYTLNQFPTPANGGPVATEVRLLTSSLIVR
jgi:hypothetical protein